MKSKNINFEYIEEFVDYIVDEVESNEDNFVTVIAKFNEAKEIIKYLMDFYYIDFDNIYLESPDERGYADEFCIELWYNDGVVNFSCDPLKVNGKYENPCGDETYLFDNCSSKIIPLCEGLDLYFVEIEDEYDCNEDCDCHKENKELSTTSSYTINGKSVSKEEFDKKYAKIVNSHRENMRSALFDYCSWMDEVKDILSRLW